MASPDVRKAGVIGWPVAHSLSPALHRYWLKRYRIAGEYEALPVAPEALKEFIKHMPQEGYRGANVTVPHKETVMPFLDEVDESARAIGAVNTIVMDRGGLKGFNTDAYGFAENLRQYGFPAARNKAVVLGAGGAAKAVCHALAKERFAQIVIAARTAAKAKAIAKALPIKTSVIGWENRSAALEGADLLVNATSLGLQGGESLEMDLSRLPETAIVSDVVYTPLDTPLLKAARARGNRTIDGLGMLLHQAAPAFEAWFGVRPEVDEETRKQVLACISGR